MGRAPCCSKVGLHRGPWSAKEDTILVNYIQQHGEGHWRSLPKKAGLLRCGKSCRLRWMNYLRPDIKRGNIAPDEEDLIIRLHSLLGNRWSLIAKRLPGRTDNEIKNYWNSHLSKRVSNGSTKTTKPKPKPSRGPKKRNVGAAAASEKIEPGKEQNPEMIKVHQPKPMRVSPFSVTRTNGFASGHGGHGGSPCGPLGAATVSLGEEAMEYRDVQNVLEDDDHRYEDYYSDIIEEGDRSHSPCNLEKIFEEYRQLLKGDDNVQLESFADSLLI